MATTARFGPDQSQQPENPYGSPTQVAGNYALELLSTTFLETLAGSWEQREIATNQTGTAHMEDWLPKGRTATLYLCCLYYSMHTDF